MAFMWCGAYSSLISGVKKWSKKSEDALKRQEAIGVEAWVKAMDSRIISLGGEGVQRFLGNLFRAFDGLFESSSLPSKYAGKAITVMQRVRQIKAVSGVSFFKKEKSLTSIDLHWPIPAKSTKAERVHTYIRDVKDKHVARDQSRGNRTSRVTFLYFYPRSPHPSLAIKRTQRHFPQTNSVPHNLLHENRLRFWICMHEEEPKLLIESFHCIQILVHTKWLWM